VPEELGGHDVYVMELPEQRIFLWFPPDGTYFSVVVARTQFQDAQEVFLSVVDHQQEAL